MEGARVPGACSALAFCAFGVWHVEPGRLTCEQAHSRQQNFVDKNHRHETAADEQAETFFACQLKMRRER
eukprot:337675-Pyramimonas_sp.AAC.1